MQAVAALLLIPSSSSSCNSSCFSRASCDAQIAYREWGGKALLQARVQACHQFLRAFPVTGGCEAGLGEERTGERE